MRKWLLALVLAAAFYLDTMFFNTVNLYGIRPDLMLAVIVSVGVLAGPAPAAAIGFGVGLLADIMFNKVVGLTALTYMLAGVAGGLFYRKFFADNLVIPMFTAMACSFLKEHILMFAALLMRARPPYFLTLLTYILPCLLLTGGSCALIHLFFKHQLYRPLWRNEAINIE